MKQKQVKTLEYEVILDIDTRKRHYHERIKDKILNFSIQLELMIAGR